MLSGNFVKKLKIVGNPLLIWTIAGLFLWAYLKTAHVEKSILKVKPTIYKAKKKQRVAVLCLSISPILSCLLNLAAATLPLSSNHTHTTEMASATKENKKNSKSLSQ